MRQFELAPFSGTSERLGSTRSCDSVVMRLVEHQPFQERVVKWNRREISSTEEAFDIIRFIRYSVDLYKTALGHEFIVPTEFVIGEKKDGFRKKIKIYSVQPFIDAWDGKNIPENLKTNDKILSQWRTLYLRLGKLYTAAKRVNAKLRPEEAAFPIELTVGSSRLHALSGDYGVAVSKLPSTPNLLIDRTDHSIKLCDFGKYLPWKEDMRSAYRNIFLEVNKSV